jgi:hypothetical protein
MLVLCRGFGKETAAGSHREKPGRLRRLEEWQAWSWLAGGAKPVFAELGEIGSCQAGKEIIPRLRKSLLRDFRDRGKHHAFAVANADLSSRLRHPWTRPLPLSATSLVRQPADAPGSRSHWVHIPPQLKLVANEAVDFLLCRQFL